MCCIHGPNLLWTFLKFSKRLDRSEKVSEPQVVLWPLFEKLYTQLTMKLKCSAEFFVFSFSFELGLFFFLVLRPSCLFLPQDLATPLIDEWMQV